VKKQLTLMAGLIVLTIACQGTSQPKQSPTAERQPAGLVFPRSDAYNQGDDKIPPLVLPDGRILVSAIDTVYMLRADHTVLWKYSAGTALTAQPAFHSALNEIAIVAFDLVFHRIDAETGKFKCGADTNGGAVFSQVAAYGRGYLVVVSMEGYREKQRLMKDSFRTLDQLDYWDDSISAHETGNVAWSVDFPIGAQLLVAGQELFAVNFSKSRVLLKPIRIPK
jgi:hypothetical protein